MELLDGFGAFAYRNRVGPGHLRYAFTTIPASLVQQLLERACSVISARRLWVDPDCGLKKRGWPETEAALTNRIAAARAVRQKLEAEEAGSVAA
ncbi:hypothetical protein [Paraburkholderia xenovorans]